MAKRFIFAGRGGQEFEARARRANQRAENGCEGRRIPNFSGRSITRRALLRPHAMAAGLVALPRTLASKNYPPRTSSKQKKRASVKCHFSKYGEDRCISKNHAPR